MKDKGIYILLISVHGLIRSEPELGRDPDTGGQVLYVLELARALARHPQVAQVDLLTRLVKDPGLPADYACPEEALGPHARILRLPFGPARYIRKELLWDHLDYLVDSYLAFARSLPRLPDLIHSHYGDAGYVALRLSSLLGIPFIHSGHSLGRCKQARLLAPGLLLGLDGGDRGHVQDPARGHRCRQDMRRTGRPDQDRPDRERVGQHLDHLIGDVGGIEARHDQDIGFALEIGVRQDQPARGLRQRGIALHFAIGLQLGMVLFQQRGGAAHLARGVGIVAAEVGMRDEGDLRFQIEALDMKRGQRGHFREFLGARIGPHLGVGDEIGALAGDHQRQCGEIADARQEADDLADMAQMAHVTALDPADHGVGLAAHHRQCRDHGGVGADHGAGGIGRHAMPAGDVDIGLHIGAVARIILGVDQIEILSGLDR